MANAPLPNDGPIRIDGVDLPNGHRLAVFITEGPLGPGTPFEMVPALWATDTRHKQVGRWWWALRTTKGMFPVLLDGLDNGEPFGQRRPWDADEELRNWNPFVPDEDNVGEILASTFWDNEDEEGFEHFFASFREFPGLAPSQQTALPVSQVESAVIGQPAAWFGLVPAQRSADVPLEAGWFGTSDAFSLGPWGEWDPAGAMTAILRSWESRFGARVLRMGFASLHLLIERPPETADEALHVAAELCGVSSEFQTPDGVAVRKVPEIAEVIREAPVWQMWWD